MSTLWAQQLSRTKRSIVAGTYEDRASQNKASQESFPLVNKHVAENRSAVLQFYVLCQSMTRLQVTDCNTYVWVPVLAALLSLAALRQFLESNTTSFLIHCMDLCY